MLESTRRIDTIVLDKTGTVTTGKMTLIGVSAAAGTAELDVRRVAAALEMGSEHPIARAIVTAYDQTPDPVTSFANLPRSGRVGRCRRA